MVPTMGYLHEGHLSLVRTSKNQTDITFVSIFVNPIQFSPNEDLNRYPRDLNRDIELLNAEKTDFVFAPVAEEIFPHNFQTYVEVNEISKKHEGEFRPAHFKGVSTIVAILFNIIKPAKSFFGQKDAQQTAVLKRMVADLKIDTEIVVCPTVREKDGLAMSSRNVYLDNQQREKAIILYNSLTKVKDLIISGERDAYKVIKTVNNNFLKESFVHLNYIRLVNADSFEEPKILEPGKSYYILIACKIGSTRLIDNILIEIPS